MKQRERAKQERRARIVEAAEALIRRSGDVSFSMRELADRAQVAPATPFNLFGSKADVLLALLGRSLDVQFERLDAARGLEPIERVFALGERGVRAYTDDEALYRPLLRGLAELCFDAPLPDLMERATRLWREALREAEAAGLLDADLDLDALSRLLHYQFRVTMLTWAAREIDAEEWAAELEYASAVLLRGAAADALRGLLHERIVRSQRAVEAARRSASARAPRAAASNPDRRRSP